MKSTPEQLSIQVIEFYSSIIDMDLSNKMALKKYKNILKIWLKCNYKIVDIDYSLGNNNPQFFIAWFS